MVSGFQRAKNHQIRERSAWFFRKVKIALAPIREKKIPLLEVSCLFRLFQSIIFSSNCRARAVATLVFNGERSLGRAPSTEGVLEKKVPFHRGIRSRQSHGKIGTANGLLELNSAN